MILEILRDGDNPLPIELNKIVLWIKIHGMVAGFMLERVARNIGNDIGTFGKFDSNNFVGGWREYLRTGYKYQCSLFWKEEWNWRRTKMFGGG